MDSTWNELSDEFLTYNLLPDSNGAYFADSDCIRRPYGFLVSESQNGPGDLARDLQCTNEVNSLQNYGNNFVDAL